VNALTILMEVASVPEILPPLLFSSRRLLWLEQHFHPKQKSFKSTSDLKHVTAEVM